jgi:hypothetical protein
VSALGGPLRAAQPRRSPERHQEWGHRRVASAPRPVPQRRERAEARVARSRTDTARRQRRPAPQGRVSRARAGLPPAGGPEGLGGLRDGRSSAGRRARRGLAAPQDAWAARLRAVPQAWSVPLTGGRSAGPRARRRAVDAAWPAVPPPRGQCHALRAAATPCAAAERPAKQARTQPLRGGRPSARPLDGRPAHAAAVSRG